MSNQFSKDASGNTSTSAHSSKDDRSPDDLAWDGERYIPGMSTEIELEHMHRYVLARKLAVGRRVLDIACGEGYGSFALADVAASVIGVDISEDAVRHARSVYDGQALNIKFQVGSAADIPLPDASVDLVVSFETIEHHDQHEAMISEIRRVLKPGGTLVISSPNKHEYSDVTGYSNPWHVKELYLDQFEALLRVHFPNVDIYGQRVVTGSMLAPLEDKAIRLHTASAAGGAEETGVARPLYFVAVASDDDLPLLDGSLYEATGGSASDISKVADGRIECKLYWRAIADEYSEAHAMGLYVRSDGNEQLARFEIRKPGSAISVGALRLDLSDRPGVVEIQGIELLDPDEAVAWRWDRKPASMYNVNGSFFLSSALPPTLIVFNDDAWLELPVPDDTLARISEGWTIAVRLSAQGNSQAIAELLAQSDAVFVELDGVLTELSRDWSEASALLKSAAMDSGSAGSPLPDAGRQHTAFERARAGVLQAKAELLRNAIAIKEQEEAREQARVQHELTVSERETRILELTRAHEALNNEHFRLVAELHVRDAELRARDLEVSRAHAKQLATEARVWSLVSSTSWRVTAPMRFVARLLKGGEERAAALRAASKMVYKRAPLPGRFKRRAKGACFRLLPGLFSHTKAYHDWFELRERLRAAASVAATSVAPAAAIVAHPEPVESDVVDAEPVVDEVNLSSQLLPIPAVSKVGEYQAFPPVAPRQVPVRAIAYYLPQFHPFPENDEWWGRGFTEWTNVTRALPQFDGHYQPHLPGELGFYDLRIPDVQRRQVELAKAAGLGGFCFYFYWFGGKRLMEAPIRQYLEHTEFDLPFCLCWANENWTRRWDGLDQELLISQHHSPEDDLAFIEHVAEYMRDPRYIRVDGKPYLMVYRPNLLPDARATVARWREWARANGLGELFLAYTQSFEKVDPREYGFDAAVEFPPNNSQPPSKAGDVTLLNRNFTGHILDWTHYVERSHTYGASAYRVFRGVTPSWDNEARKPGRGSVFVGSTPKLYQEWLYNAAVDTVRRIPQPDERLVFINAWNEWAEGAHLEPDRKYGYAWLQATNDALTRANSATGGRRVVVVTHDAHPHGAQFLALNLARSLSTEFGFDVAIVVLGGGPLKAEFARWGQVHDLEGIDPEGEQATKLVQTLLARGFHAALCNTTVSGLFLHTMSIAGIRCVALIHELQGMLAKYQLERHAELIAQDAVKVVFPAATVQRSFEQIATVQEGCALIRPQGLYKRNVLRGDRARAHSAVREELHLPADVKIVLGVGFGDHRKGVDLFVRAGKLLGERNDNVRFVWIGHWDADTRREIDAWIAEHNCANLFVFPGLRGDTDLYYAGSDVLALTSREDPFPSVVLESLEVGVPVVAFEGATGAGELLKDCGLLVPFEDEVAFANALAQLLGDPVSSERMGMNGARLVAEEFSFRHYIFDLLDMVGCGLKRTSVIVPNFNYERYIDARLDSVLTQTYPIYELIVLDDRSMDGSVERIKAKLANQAVDNRLIVNGTNSGSVFAQWKRGVELARGDYVWIAEADDLALPDMLEQVSAGLQDRDVVLSYCESKQMGESGDILCEHYRDYVADISSTRWNDPYVGSGVTEIREVLAVKNTIPNVSAVVFRRAELTQVLETYFDEVKRFRVAGDWMVYLRVLEKGKVAYVPESLNLHRRHGSSVTIGGFGEAQLREIRSIQMWIREQHNVALPVAEIADAYSLKLCSQFNLDEEVVADVVGSTRK